MQTEILCRQAGNGGQKQNLKQTINAIFGKTDNISAEKQLLRDLNDLSEIGEPQSSIMDFSLTPSAHHKPIVSSEAQTLKQKQIQEILK